MGEGGEGSVSAFVCVRACVRERQFVREMRSVSGRMCEIERKGDRGRGRGRGRKIKRSHSKYEIISSVNCRQIQRVRKMLYFE